MECHSDWDPRLTSRMDLYTVIHYLVWIFGGSSASDLEHDGAILHCRRPLIAKPRWFNTDARPEPFLDIRWEKVESSHLSSLGRSTLGELHALMPF